MIKLGLQSLSYRDTFIAGEIDMFGFLQRAADLRLDGIPVSAPRLRYQASLRAAAGERYRKLGYDQRR